MQDTLEKELPEHKRHIFLMCLPKISLPVLEKKRQALRKDIWKWALYFYAGSVVSILSVPCGVHILRTVMIGYQKAFGMDENSLKKLADKFSIDVSELRSVIKSPIVVQEINEEIVNTLLETWAKENAIIQYLRTIPLLCNLAPADIPFGTAYQMLCDFLNKTAEDAERVLMKALELPI
ncbi:interferon-inducible GTPase 5-like [Ranitomeya variabilis]|uniref:interferon-inducible GTPase 5-like n=1 Tax=Ranitomeya variabilis TaxID=490064 RepID=UPI0040570758